MTRKIYFHASIIFLISMPALLLHQFRQVRLDLELAKSVQHIDEKYAIELLMQGADPNSPSTRSSGNWFNVVAGTAHARQPRQDTYVSVLEQAVDQNMSQTVLELIRRGARDHSKDITRRTSLLMTAVKASNELIARVLFNHGEYDLDERDGVATPLIMLAAQQNMEELALSILQRGANASLGNSVGQDALCTAADKRQLKLAQALLERGVDPNHCPPDNRPLTIAVANGHLDMAELLVKYGAKPDVASIASAENNGSVEVERYLKKCTRLKH